MCCIITLITRILQHVKLRSYQFILAFRSWEETNRNFITVHRCVYLRGTSIDSMIIQHEPWIWGALSQYLLVVNIRLVLSIEPNFKISGALSPQASCVYMALWCHKMTVLSVNRIMQFKITYTNVSFFLFLLFNLKAYFFSESRFIYKQPEKLPSTTGKLENH